MILETLLAGKHYQGAPLTVSLTLYRTDDAAFITPHLTSEHPRTYNPYEESFENVEAGQELAVPETSIERDNKLLAFNLPTYNFTLLDYSLRRTSLSLAAQLHGMFFMADLPNNATPDKTQPSAELTCYRRNLFQITGSITLPRMMRYILTEHGDRIPILAQELTISATESSEGHPVKLISVPWKTPASNATSTPDDKTEKEPTPIPLDTVSNQDMDADYATFPIAWKRLQFRIATANNGRRKELQQHFVVRLKVVATLSTGTKVPICEIKSGAIIVRGRSPRNFQQRKEVSVGSSGNTARKAMQPPALNRSATCDSSLKQHSSSIKTEASTESNPNTFSFDNHDIQTQNGYGDRSTAAARVRSTSDSHPTSSTTDTPAAAPMRLSLTDDVDASQRSYKAARKESTDPVTRPGIDKQPSTASVFNQNAHASLANGLDSADLLYEYFPLGLDDWMPPVDAVYRPHVVHHVTRAGPAAGAKGSASGRSKRYFAEDQS